MSLRLDIYNGVFRQEARTVYEMQHVTTRMIATHVQPEVGEGVVVVV